MLNDLFLLEKDVSCSLGWSRPSILFKLPCWSSEGARATHTSRFILTGADPHRGKKTSKPSRHDLSIALMLLRGGFLPSFSGLQNTCWGVSKQEPKGFEDEVHSLHVSKEKDRDLRYFAGGGL